MFYFGWPHIIMSHTFLKPHKFINHYPFNIYTNIIIKMSTNNYHNYQFTYLDQIKRKKKYI